MPSTMHPLSSSGPTRYGDHAREHARARAHTHTHAVAYH